MDGLAEHAAFDFSMYKLEPLDMLVPDIYGGSTDIPVLPTDRSRAAQALAKMPPALAKEVGEDGPRYYWGGVGELMSGPPYVGAIVILLALIGFFIPGIRHRWWILGVAALTIAMSWGGYFHLFNSLLVKYLPMYNKFRAPSMIIVVPTFLFSMLAMITLQKIMEAKDRVALWRSYKWTLMGVAGIFLLLTLLYFRFDYASVWEEGLLKKAAAGGSASRDANRPMPEPRTSSPSSSPSSVSACSSGPSGRRFGGFATGRPSSSPRRRALRWAAP